MTDIAGMPVIFDHFLCDRVQWRKPRSKKKRIRNKWKKDPRNWKSVPKKEIWRVGNSFVVHPEYWEELKPHLNLVTKAASNRYLDEVQAQYAQDKSNQFFELPRGGAYASYCTKAPTVSELLDLIAKLPKPPADPFKIDRSVSPVRQYDWEFEFNRPKYTYSFAPFPYATMMAS